MFNPECRKSWSHKAVKQQVLYFVCVCMTFVVYETQPPPPKAPCKQNEPVLFLMPRTQKCLIHVEIGFFFSLPQNPPILSDVNVSVSFALPCQSLQLASVQGLAVGHRRSSYKHIRVCVQSRMTW